MSAPLLSDGEMAAIREVGIQGMQTPGALLRRTSVKTDDGFEQVYTSVGTIMGWLYSTPSPVITEMSGKMVLVNTYRWYCAVGTDIRSGDHLVVGANTFIVSDTTGESTWNAMLVCSLRFAE